MVAYTAPCPFFFTLRTPQKWLESPEDQAMLSNVFESEIVLENPVPEKYSEYTRNV